MLMSSPKTSWFDRSFSPKISEEAYVSATAMVTGPVTVSADVMIGPGASVRGDEGGNIFIGPKSNVQDNAIMHGLLHKAVQIGEERYAIYISEQVSCAHASIIHGPAFIGNNSFIGFGTIVHSTRIGKHCFIGHGAKIIGVEIADHKFVPHGAIIDCQEKADALGPIPEQFVGFNDEVVKVNVELARGYKRLQEGV